MTIAAAGLWIQDSAFLQFSGVGAAGFEPAAAPLEDGRAVQHEASTSDNDARPHRWSRS